MRVVISPAKNMKEERVEGKPLTRPVFVEKAEEILEAMRQLSPMERKAIWACNDKLAVLNEERLKKMDPTNGYLQAIEAYDGMVFKHLKPALETDAGAAYLMEHVSILSGFYGVLKPSDGICPYRLEMQAKMKVGGEANLYAFWGSLIHDEIFKDGETVLNLASSEYDKCLRKYIQPQDRMVSVVFGQWKNGKIVTQSTAAKTARGEMVRWLAEEQIKDVEEVKGFERLGYRYVPERSNENEYIFLQNL